MKRVAILAGLAVALVAVLAGGVMLVESEPKSEQLAADLPQPPGATQASTVPKDAYVLDVRTPEEFAAGHAEIAVNLPLQDIEAGTLPQVDKNQKVYLYCRSGNRSAQAATLLREAGYTNIEDLGGLDDAKQAGLAFTN